MNSFIKKIINLFFEKPNYAEKPLIRRAQFILIVASLFSFYFVGINIGKSNYPTYSSISDFLIGTLFVLYGIENFINNKNKFSGYLFYFCIAVFFYWEAINFLVNIN